MKKILIAAFLLFCLLGVAQQKETIVVNPVKQNEHEVLEKMYQYPQFVSGNAIYESGEVVASKMNYNCLTNQVCFISPRGDTLELTNGGDFSKIVMNVDTFFYFNKQFIQLVSHYPTYNLLKRRTLQNSGWEKRGAYGTYSGNSAITTVNSIPNGDNGYVRLPSDENISFVFKETYFLSGKFGKFYPATKKGAIELFGKDEKYLKEFLQKNSIDFSKREDIEKLLVFAQSVLK
ncbi:MAG: hypothetical protein ACXVLT_02705 [Flavisolibacter sp.]